MRWKDLSALDLSKDPELPATLLFNLDTVWPAKLPAGVVPAALLEGGKNPGLGVRALHKAGITGRGVAVAIIDQPLRPDHPEFAGRIVKFFDTGCDFKGRIHGQGVAHGPGVASLLAGKDIGTAPEARVYFAAVPGWKADAAYYAKALDWIMAENEKLPAGEKIRVVSVSAAPSGLGSQITKNNKMWDSAFARAEKAGLLVLDCEKVRGFIGVAMCDPKDPENPSKCRKGLPNLAAYGGPETLLAPASGRTVAEDHDFRYEYSYFGQGGRSWAVPYVAGVAAMGWQVAPGLTAAQMKDLLLRSAAPGTGGIIDPAAFIALVKAAVPARP